MVALGAGLLRGGRGGGGVAAAGLALGLQLVRARLLAVGALLGRLGGGLQRPDQRDGGLGAGRERGRGVALGLADRGGDPRGPVGGGPVTEHQFGGLPGGVERAGVEQLAPQGGGVGGGVGQRQTCMTVRQLGGDERLPGTGVVRGGHRVGRGGDLLLQLAGPRPLQARAGGKGPGEASRAAFGGAVVLPHALTCGRRLGDAVQQIERAAGEVPLGGQLGATTQLRGEAVHQVREPVGVAGVGDGAQQQVGEVLVAPDREETGRLTLVGVHLALVAEEFRVESERAQVLGPTLVALLPGDLQLGGKLAGLHQQVAEALHGAAAAAGADLRRLLARRGHQHRAFGDGERVEAEGGAGPERVPGLGELARVGGDLASTPLADLADDDGLAGERVLPLERDMSAVVGEQELAQHAGAGAAERVAVTGQHHREDQLEQHGLAAAVLQEQHARGRRAAHRSVVLLVEEPRLARRRVGDGIADAAQVEHGVGVPRTGRADGVQANPVQLVHGAADLRSGVFRVRGFQKQGGSDAVRRFRRCGTAGRRR